MSQAGQTLLVVDDSPTVLRVMEAVLSQAGYNVVCLDGGAHAVEQALRIKPDLVFVDFAMPEVNGYAVCRALGQEPGLASIPIVIMNTRGDVVGERFVREMAVADYITKPFSPEALLAVVEHTIEKSRSGEPGPRPAAGAALGTSEPLSSTTRLARLLAPVVLGVSDPAELAERLSQAFGDPALRGELRLLLRTHIGGEALCGDLVKVAFAEVLQLLALQRQSGVLTIERKGSTVSIFLKDGEVRFVTGTHLSHELLLGRILVREKLIRSEDLELLLSNRRGTRRRLGRQLVDLGYLTREQLHHALRHQSSEIVYDLLRWREGYFAFEPLRELPGDVLEFEFGLGIDELLMEGFRRVDEWGVIEMTLPSFDLVPRVLPGALDRLGADRLTKVEEDVLGAVDGRRTAHEVIEVVGKGTFEVARVLYRMISTHVVSLDGARGKIASDGADVIG